MLRWYGYVGIALIAFAIANFSLVIQPFARWYIPIIWYGYILLVDSLVQKVSGRSLISTYPKEFVFMAGISVPFWLIFEVYNIFGGYWQYTNYTWHAHLADFTTILPAVLVTYALFRALGAFRRFDTAAAKTTVRKSRAYLWPLVVLGAAATVAPLLIPGIGAPFVWVGLFLLLDPLDYMLGRASAIDIVGNGKTSFVLQLFAAGITMGFFWELWNNFAYSRWVYNIQIVSNIPKLFAMPLPGYLGYLPFAVVVFLFYALFRPLVFKKKNLVLGI
ncbi:MAG TPA: hypothetical protein VND15_00630 [Candidatus Acidoferrales bacterium]|nr:hypothetical protein [Candidatus Acidoferrales bacterium]